MPSIESRREYSLRSLPAFVSAGDGNAPGSTARTMMAARRRKGSVKQYISFSMRASPYVVNTISDACSTTGECRTTDVKNIRRSPNRFSYVRWVGCCTGQLRVLFKT